MGERAQQKEYERERDRERQRQWGMEIVNQWVRKSCTKKGTGSANEIDELDLVALI